MNTAAAEWQRAFEDAHAENVALMAEARKRDKAIAVVVGLLEHVMDVLKELDD